MCHCDYTGAVVGGSSLLDLDGLEADRRVFHRGEESIILAEASGGVELVDRTNNAISLQSEGAMLLGDVVDNGRILTAHLSSKIQIGILKNKENIVW